MNYEETRALISSPEFAEMNYEEAMSIFSRHQANVISEIYKIRDENKRKTKRWHW